MPYAIDINADVGENIGNEEALFQYVSSCNIACGGHSGDAKSIERMLDLAQKNNVKIGAHPSYPDKENFGRKSISISKAALKESIQEQLNLISRISEKPLNHIKPHGALYNDLAKSEDLATTFLAIISAYKKTSYLYVPPNSIIEQKAKNEGFKIIREAFIDRAYQSDLQLVSRKTIGASITDKQLAFSQLVSIVKHQKLTAINGEECAINAETFCIHGDNPNAIEILQFIHAEIGKTDIFIHK